MTDQEAIIENLKEIHQRINTACNSAGRNIAEVKLLLATKTVDPSRIKYAIEAGETLIGENKVQEYTSKWEALKNEKIERHFIGHLQTNKIKEIIKYVTCIESIDRIDLATKLSQKLVSEDQTMDIFVEVNTSNEESKSGIAVSNAINLIKQIAILPNLTIKGLMTIGVQSDDETAIRQCFKFLAMIKREGQQLGLLPDNCELSMGMSHDMEIAIEEGATIIRIGSAIFGRRNY